MSLAKLLRVLALGLAILFVPGCPMSILDATDTAEEPEVPAEEEPPAEDPPAEEPPAEEEPPPAEEPPVINDGNGPTLDPGFNESTNLIEVFFDNAKSERENGSNLRSVLQNAEPGDLIRIHGGRYEVNSSFRVNLDGTEANPITIEAAEGETVHVHQATNKQNLIDVDRGSWFTIRGLEFTCTGLGLRLHDVHHGYVVGNHIHDTGGTAVAMNSRDTHHMYFVDNHIHDTAVHGEGFYLGANNAQYITHHTYVVGNHIHDTKNSDQGDGIEIKEGSYACVISDNVIENTHYPCILVYGTRGNPERNIIERNICIGTDDYCIQAASDAIVRNNILIDGKNGCMAVQPHQSSRPMNMTIVNNTMINSGICLQTRAWNESSTVNILVANNVMVSTSGSFIAGNLGNSELVFRANHQAESLTGLFVDLNLTGTKRDATPKAGSPLLSAGNADDEPDDDYNKKERTGGVEIGAVDVD